MHVNVAWRLSLAKVSNFCKPQGSCLKWMSISWVSVLWWGQKDLLQVYCFSALPNHCNDSIPSHNSEPSKRVGLFFFLGTLPLQNSDRAREIVHFSLAELIFLFLLIVCTDGLCILSTSLALMNMDSRDCVNAFSLAFSNPVGAMCNTLIAYMGQVVFGVHVMSSDWSP